MSDASNNYRLARQLQEAFMAVGETMIKPDFAAKLMAFVYVFGSELTVLHQGMVAGIGMAQELCNLDGGRIPNPEMFLLIKARIEELKAAHEIKACDVARRYEYTIYETGTVELLAACPWLQEIFDRYGLAGIAQMAKPKKQKTDESD